MKTITITMAMVAAVLASGCATRQDVGRVAGLVSALTNMVDAVGGSTGGGDAPNPDEHGNVPLAAFAGRYVDGDRGDKGPEIAAANIGHGLNLRYYNNAGNLPCKSSRAWYPIDAGVIPDGTCGWEFLPDGGLRVWGKDFVSTRTGQAYRWEGAHIGTSEDNPVRPYSSCVIPAGDVCGALILNWAAVEARP